MVLTNQCQKKTYYQRKFIIFSFRIGDHQSYLIRVGDFNNRDNTTSYINEDQQVRFECYLASGDDGSYNKRFGNIHGAHKVLNTFKILYLKNRIS